MTIIFFGSSEFSISALKACLKSKHEVVLVVTTPDQKKGRGLKLGPTVVKEFCLTKGIPVISPARLKDPDSLRQAEALNPDLFVVSSYGKFIPASWLVIPSKYALNVHPSLLPKYRGASPLHWPIIQGDAESGVSVAEVTDQLDSGDIFAQEKFKLPPRIDSAELTEALAELSYHVLKKVLEKLEKGEDLPRTPQEEQQSSYARKLEKEDGYLSFKDTAVSLDRKIRGLKPWPGTYFEFGDSHVIVLDAEPCAVSAASTPGTLTDICRDGSISVATADGILKIRQVKPAGKNPMSAADFVHGRRLQSGFIFESA